MKSYAFDAVDALFFRDGRPYRMADANDPGNDQADVVTVFPPSPYSVVGAIRAGFALEQGWSGSGSWDDVCKRVLGDRMDLGALRFRGPFLARENKDAYELLYRLPANVVVRRDETGRPHVALLGLYDEERTVCDIGEVRLPGLPPGARGELGWKVQTGAFVTHDGMQQVLQGGVLPPASIVSGEDLFETESRLGLWRGDDTHVAEDEGALYSPSFVRFQRGVRLIMQVEGVPENWNAPTLVPLGGEGRMAIADSFPKTAGLPGQFHEDFDPANAEEVEFTFTVLTPLRLPLTGSVPVGVHPGYEFFQKFGEEVEIVSACVDRPEYIGGWDSIGSRPLPARPHLPAGSVLFCRAKADNLRRLLKSSATGLGPDSSFGINQFAIGKFPIVQQ